MEHNLEKDLRRWLKRKISISLATIVVFAITGSIGFAADPITSAGNNEFTGNNTFKGEKQESTFTVEVKGKATDPKDKSKTLEDQESTVKHTLTAVGSYTRADGKKKIHNEIKKRGQLDNDKPEDQIVFHTLDDTGSHLVARGAKKINGQNGQDSSVTIHSKIFDENNKEIASQTLKHDGIHTVVRNKDSVIANQVKNSIYSHMTGKGMNTVGEKDKFIRQEVKESVVTRLDKDGSSTIVDVITASNTSPSIKDVVEEVEYQMENGKKVRKSKGELASHILNKNGSTIKVKNGNTIVSEVESGAKLVMDKDASRFTKDLYVGNNVWKDTSAIGNQLVIGNQSNEAKKKDSIAIGFDNSVIREGAVALGKNNVISGQGSVVIGDTNDVSGKKSVAVGALNSVLSKDSVAVGSDNFIDAEGAGSFGRGEATVNSNGTVTHKYKNEGKNSYTFGNYNSIAKGTENNFILGNKVKIEEKINNSVVLGNESTVRKATTETKGTVGGIEFEGFAGQGKPENGVVSVGAEGKERQIINVAAGKVSKDSTDAINGSQLFSAVQKLTDTGLTFQGNDDKLVQRKLGETLVLKGEGVSKEQSEKFEGASGNINVKNSTTGALELQLAKKLQNIESISNGANTITLNTDKVVFNQALHMGTKGNEHQIKFVADGSEDTDAVNFRQLEKAKTRYYSVKSTEKGAESNYNNDGATGQNAMAAGVKSKASGINSTAVGYDNNVMGANSSAIGHKNIVNKGANNSSAIGEDNIITSSKSIAFGRKNTVKSFSSSAVGTENTIEANSGNSVAMGALNKVETEASNSIVSGRKNAVQQGSSHAVAFGEENTVKGSYIYAFGGENKIIGNDSSAIGKKNEVEGRYNLVLGAENKVKGSHNTVIGEKNEVAKNSEYNFMLGSNIKVKENIKNSIVLGKDSTVEESDVVSIGATGKERKIVHVKEGVADTDAVNVSQLKKYSSDLEKKGLNFAGNDEVSVHRDLGQTLALKGEGVDKAASKDFKGAAGNINVKNSKDGELELQLAKDLQNIESISNKKTKIALLKDSIAMNQALHMGDSNTQHQIKYVADGTELTDAVNLKQLKEYNAELEKKGLNFAGNDGKVIHKNLGEQLDIVGSLGDGEDASSQNLRTRKTDDGKLELLLAQNLNLNSVTTGNTIINNFGVTIQNGDKKVTLSENGLDNGGNKIVNVAAGENETDAVNKGQLDKAVAAATTEVTAGKNIDVTVATGDNGQKVYQVGLKDKITLGEGEKAVEIDGEQGTLKVGNKITMDGTTGKATFGKIDVNGEQGTIGGLTNKTWDPNNYTSGQAATEDQLKVVDKKVEDLGTTIGKGYTFAGDSGSVNKKLGDTVKIAGDGKNITTSVTEDGELKVALNKKIEVEQITSEKMIIKDKDGNTTDVGETLKEHSEQIQENSEAIKKGLNFAGNHGTTNKQLGDTMSIKGKEGVSEEDVQSKYDTENVVTTVDKDGNLWIKLSKNPKFNSVEAGDGETKVTIGNDGVKIGDKIYITKEGLNANNQKIVNVADGTIAQDSKDAVNGGQIHNIVQDINNSINQTNQRVDKLDDRMHRGLANSAAMATLEFLEIGINQATVGAAVGTYRGNQAVAVGVQAAPTENTRVHAKVSVAPSRNNTETMAGVGASWRFNWK
ncbi:YadA-like family protein [Fusobacterium necrophorum]|uniref:YadA-like family protein n=1 Tax=Fusobacterium necrophorum TaxID=859 RepID=UPI00254A933D|nr:YadA-like family protein [Fusobacterium necrophorum]MDK4487012.1 YadA-like family protein [Fusobacterium necrophorum]